MNKNIFQRIVSNKWLIIRSIYEENKATKQYNSLPFFFFFKEKKRGGGYILMSRNPNSATYSNFSCQVCMWWNRFPLTALQSWSVPISCYQGTDNKAHNESDIALNVSRICQKDFSNLQKLHQKLMMVLFTFCIYFCSCLHWAEQDTCYQFCREAAVWKSHCKEQSHPSGNLYLAPMVILNNVNSFVSWPFNTYFHLSALLKQILPITEKIFWHFSGFPTMNEILKNDHYILFTQVWCYQRNLTLSELDL